jgi:hypothetical protein
MYFLASTIVSGFGDYIWDGSSGRTVSGWSFLQSLVHTLTLYLLLWVLFPLLRTEVPTLWSSFFLSFIWSVNFILGILNFWTNIHLLVSTYLVCSFVIGLTHSGYFLVPAISSNATMTALNRNSKNPVVV